MTFYLKILTFFYLSIYLSIYPSILSIYLSIHPDILSIYRNIPMQKQASECRKHVCIVFVTTVCWPERDRANEKDMMYRIPWLSCIIQMIKQKNCSIIYIGHILHTMHTCIFKRPKRRCFPPWKYYHKYLRHVNTAEMQSRIRKKREREREREREKRSNM